MWTWPVHKDAHLSQEVVLRVVVQRGDGACGPEPGVDRHLLLLSLPQAAVVGEADVCFQLGDLRWHPSGTGRRRGRLGAPRSLNSPFVN